MKIKFVVESIRKIDMYISSSPSLIFLQNHSSGTKGDFYEFKLLYPFSQNDKVEKMIEEFKDSFITHSKHYQLDQKTGVLVLHSIATQETEPNVLKLIDEILNNDDCFTVLLIKHQDEFVSKLAAMKIKFFDQEEFEDVDNLFKNEMTEMFDE